MYHPKKFGFETHTDVIEPGVWSQRYVGVFSTPVVGAPPKTPYCATLVPSRARSLGHGAFRSRRLRISTYPFLKHLNGRCEVGQHAALVVPGGSTQSGVHPSPPKLTQSAGSYRSLRPNIFGGIKFGSLQATRSLVLEWTFWLDD